MTLARMDYDDGGWCDRKFVGRQLHGRWTVYFLCERNYQHRRRDGYEREWDVAGNLLEDEDLNNYDKGRRNDSKSSCHLIMVWSLGAKYDAR